MTKQNTQLIELNKQQKYILGKSLNDSWGYPYKQEKVKFLSDREKYKEIGDKLDNNDYTLDIFDLPLVLNSLEMLYYENGDFEALYDNVTRDDVKSLLNKLTKAYKDYEGN